MKRNDGLGGAAEASGRTKDYRADAGFTRRTDSNNFFFANRVSTKSKPKAPVIRANFNQFVRYGLDFRGRMQQALFGGNVNLSMQGNLFIYFESGVGWEKIYEDEFGPIRTATRQGGFFGAPSRTASRMHTPTCATGTPRSTAIRWPSRLSEANMRG